MESNDVFSFLDEKEISREEEQDLLMTKCFRRVFSTEDGKRVLHQILTDLKFYSEIKDDTDRALNNYAKYMIFSRLKINNSRKITESILAINHETGE